MADVEGRPADLYGADSEKFLEGEVDVKKMMDLRMRASEDAVRRRDYRPDAIKQMDESTEDIATPTAPRPNRAPETERPGTDPSLRA